jgi:hypothetical protein
MKIKSPVADYTGTDTYGETVLEFKDGVADFDGDLPAGVRQYLAGAGYGLGSHKPAEPEDVPAPPDPREHTGEQVGTELRDAAVDPHPEDFLAPVNAGKEGEAGNPHGPNVVAPQIHASSGQAVVPGPVGRYEVEETDDGGKIGVVHPDVDEQDARESEFAQRALAGSEPVPDVTADLGKEAGQPAPGEPAATELKGAALDDALEAAGLSKSGTADEKRARLAEHRGEA